VDLLRVIRRLDYHRLEARRLRRKILDVVDAIERHEISDQK